MGITVLKHNAPWGPFTREQIQDGLARGDFTLQYLAHARGLKEWLPLGEVLHMIDAGAIPPSVPLAQEPTPTALPPQPPRLTVPPLPMQLSARTPLPTIPHTPPVPPKASPVEVDLPPLPPPDYPTLPTGSFIARGFAFLIDCGVLFVPIALIFLIGAVTIVTQGWWQRTDGETLHQQWELLHRNMVQLLLLVAIGFAWIYAAGLECSRWQATLGKRWMGVKVADLHGQRIDFIRASARHFAKYLSALPFFLGFMAALFSRRGLALHDRLAGTRVIRDSQP